MFKKFAATYAVVMVMSVPSTFAGTHVSAEATEPFNFVSACTDDTISGTVTVTVSAVEELNGNTFHLDIHSVINGTATGSPSGANYILDSTLLMNEEQSVDLPLTGEADIITNVELIGQGSVPNEKAAVVAHVTVNADGTITVLHTTVRDNCLG